MKPSHFNGWAVRFGPCVHDRLAGASAFRQIPDTHLAQTSGVVGTALFRTKAHAALALKMERALCSPWAHANFWRGARPVKVRITIGKG